MLSILNYWCPDTKPLMCSPPCGPMISTWFLCESVSLPIINRRKLDQSVWLLAMMSVEIDL